MITKHKTYEEGQCHVDETPPCADCSLEGAVVKELLNEKNGEACVEMLKVEDKSGVLVPFVAEMILNSGDAKAYSRKELGYFMLVAKKVS